MQNSSNAFFPKSCFQDRVRIENLSPRWGSFFLSLNNVKKKNLLWHAQMIGLEFWKQKFWLENKIYKPGEHIFFVYLTYEEKAIFESINYRMSAFITCGLNIY